MFVVLITGGLGAGKSTASAYFRQQGAATIDLDQIAAHLMTPGCATLNAVVEAFGPGVLNDDGTLNRRALAEIAFTDGESARTLNGIVHPAVARELGPSLTEIRLLPNQPPVIAVEVPLVVEAPVFAHMADDILAISAPEDVRIARAVTRGLNEEDARRRIALQATDEERSAMADETIVNDGTKDEFERRLLDYWNRRVVGREVEDEAT